MRILAQNCGGALFFNVSGSRSATRLISSSFAAYFRSTPSSFEKWRDKWFSPSGFEGGKPSKTYTKYKNRQKRAGAKKALNDVFFGSGRSNFTLKGEFFKKRRTTIWDEDPSEDKKKRDTSVRGASKARQKKKKNKSKKAYSYKEIDDDDDSRTHFHATYGNRQYSWSFKSWEESFYSNTRNKFRTASDDESTEDDEPYVGSHSDRITLGLPMNGPLKIEEVKNAFRISALKWHPDKHQGPSQALAEEKFKLCASAYKSLCNDLSQV